MEKMFFYCKMCNKKVETKYRYCDCGKPLWTQAFYTEEEVEHLIHSGENVESKDKGESSSLTENEGDMMCPICNKRYGKEYTICTDCGMALQLYACTPNTGTVEIMASEDEQYGERLDTPTWKLSVKRFSKDKKCFGNDIIIKRSVMSLGRGYVAFNHVFSDNIKEDSDSIINVSKYNAFLIVQEGNLYIQYDTVIHSDETERKARAPIYINGILLKELECKKLEEGNSIIMGHGAGINGNYQNCIEFIVKQVTANTEIGMMGAYGIETKLQELLKNQELIKENQESMKDSLDYAENIQRQTLSNTTEIREGICKLESLQIEKYSNIAEYLKEIQEFESEYRKFEKTWTAEEYIDEYLCDYADKNGILNSLNEAQRDCLYYAAFFESVIKKGKRTNSDYSAPTIYLGKLLESYLYQTVRPLLEKYFREQWNEVLQEFKRFKNPALGDYTTAIERAEAQNDDLFRQIAEEVKKCCPEGALSESEVKEAFVSIDPVRSIRNISAHSNVRAVWANQRKRVKYDEYIQAKNTLFRNKVFVRLSHCYRVLIKGK